jgi:hypothetical protein
LERGAVFANAFFEDAYATRATASDTVALMQQKAIRSTL